MSRELFSALGALSEADLARALAAIGSGLYGWTPSHDLASLLSSGFDGFSWRESPAGPPVLDIRVRVVAIDGYARALKEQTPGAPSAADLLSRWHAVFGNAEPPLRFSVDLTYRYEPEPPVDLGWLAQLFNADGLQTVAVHFAWPPERLTLEWNWPLRIGIPAGVWTASLRAGVERCTYRSLFDLVDLSTPGARCDLLLMPSGVGAAPAEVAAVASVHPSAVVLVGGVEVMWPFIKSSIDTLRGHFRPGAIGAAFVLGPEIGLWFETFMAAVSHNATLDQALYVASRGREREFHRSQFPELVSPSHDLIKPIVFGHREFFDQARMLHLARRMGRAAVETPYATMPVTFRRPFSRLTLSRSTVADAGRALTDVSGNLLFDQETTDATALAEFQSQIAAAIGGALDLPPLVVGAGLKSAKPPLPDGAAPRSRPAPSAPAPPAAAAEPPAPAPAPRVDRFVMLELRRRAQSGAWEPHPFVVPSAWHAIDVFIGPHRDGVVSAPRRFDESQLPPSASGHDLRVAFTPLWRDADGQHLPAQTKEIHLPVIGDSGRAQFAFVPPARLADLRARLVVLHRNRVLETLIVDAVDGSAGATLRLAPENKVSHDFGQDTVAPEFHAALVINDNPQGVTGITAVTDDGASFFEPDGIKVLVADIRGDLAALNAPDDETDEVIKGLDDARVAGLLYRLAMRGVGLAKVLKAVPQLAGFMASGTKLQVTDAVSGAYFPVEFVYDGKAPAPGATRCEHAVAALGDLQIHRDCPHRADENYVCPAAFWGFSRCIERQPPHGQPGYRFSQPHTGATVLRPLRQALFAASSRVRPQDLGSPNGLGAVLAAQTQAYAQAGTWGDWKTRIAGDHPSLLVLLPHSLDSPNVAHMPSLEIGGISLESVRLDEDYVGPSSDNPPMVLLLGCSTTLPGIPFLNFVQEFKGAGAALVIGTLATIRGRQTVDFVRELLAAVSASAGRHETFDETFLRVKQRMLAAGDPFVLSLVAYGDTGWRVES